MEDMALRGQSEQTRVEKEVLRMKYDGGGGIWEPERVDNEATVKKVMRKERKGKNKEDRNADRGKIWEWSRRGGVLFFLQPNSSSNSLCVDIHSLLALWLLAIKHCSNQQSLINEFLIAPSLSLPLYGLRPLVIVSDTFPHCGCQINLLKALKDRCYLFFLWFLISYVVQLRPKQYSNEFQTNLELH